MQSFRSRIQMNSAWPPVGPSSPPSVSRFPGGRVSAVLALIVGLPNVRDQRDPVGVLPPPSELSSAGHPTGKVSGSESHLQIERYNLECCDQYVYWRPGQYV